MLKIPLEPGIIKEERFTIKEEHSAKSVGSGEVKVLSTPSMIAFMEATSRDLIQPHLQAGYTTVGTRADVRHLSPAPVGQEIIVRSELVAVDGRKLVFKVEALWKGAKIGEGTHERYIVNLERFLEKIRKEFI
ncbi:MAG TPA: thioesterase [Candidatus Korarchaeota archaeon]|nr:thioesterase [Candidatus Korarchaeota archaeon]